MTIGKLRRVGHSLVVTIPQEDVRRLSLAAGDLVAVEVRKVTVRATPEMAPEVREAFERSWARYEADYRYLAREGDDPAGD